MMSGAPILSRVMLLIGLCLISVSIFTAAGYALINVLYGINPLENTDFFSANDLRSIAALKLLQGFSAFGLFVFPPLAFAWMTCAEPLKCLQLDRKPDLRQLLLFMLIVLASTPLINFLFFLNQQMDLPVILQPIEDWMKSSEDEAARITEAFLKVPSPEVILVNLFLIAFLPAVGEELLFRGVFQKLFSQSVKNAHVAIIITAFFFSAFHMQFYGFLPRFMLGLLLGYALLWSQSLWLPILIHFMNNGIAVIMAWIAELKKMPFDQDTIGTEPGDTTILIASVLITAGALTLAYRNRPAPWNAESPDMH